MIRPLMLALAMGAAVAAPQNGGAESWRGLVAVPAGVDPSAIRVELHAEPPTVAENARRTPVALFQPTIDGMLELEWPEGTESTAREELEFVGPGVRRARFPVPVGTESDFRFTLGPGATSVVIVTSEASGEPIPGAVLGPVTLVDERVGEAELLRHFPFFVETDEVGRATVHGLVEGFVGYEATVTAPAHERRKVQISSGRDTTIALPEGGLSLSGTVVGARSLEPRPGARVMIEGGDRFLALERIADEEGTFDFSSLPRGDYQLFAAAGGQNTVEATNVTLMPGARAGGFILPVFEGLDIVGVVIDLETDSPIEGAEVFLDPSETASATTDHEGFFRIESAMGPWPRALRVAKEGYRFDGDSLAAELRVISPSTGDLDNVRLGMTRERWLVVRAPENEGPALLLLAGGRSSQGTGARALRLTGQRTRIPLQDTGRFALFVQDGDATASDLERFELGIGDAEAEVEVFLREGARLRGQVARPAPENPEDSPAPLPRFRAVLSAELTEGAGNWVEMVSVGGGDGGLFDFRALPDGDYRLAIARPDSPNPFHEERVTLVRGETHEVFVELPAGRTLEGFVRDPLGEPVVGAEVTLRGTDMRGAEVFLTRRTFADGLFLFEELGGEVAREIRVEHGAHSPWVGNDIALDLSPMEIELEGWQRLRVVLPDVPPRSTTAHLMMATQSPIPFVGLTTVYAETVRVEFHGESHAEIEPRLDGRFRVAVEREGHWDVSAPFAWSREQEGFDIALNPGPGSSAQLRVMVPGVDARELDALAENVALPSHRIATEFRPASASGNLLTFGPLPPGEYLLTVFGADGSSAIETGIDLASGESREIRLSLEREEVELIGSVLVNEADGPRPAVGARVALLDPDLPEGAPIHREVLGAAGNFVFPGLEPGKSYVLRVEAEGLAPRLLPVVLPAGAGDSVSEVFLLEHPVRVRVALPDAVMSGPRPVLLFPMGGGSPVVIAPGALGDPVEVTPGAYRATWGEDPLGTVQVPGTVGEEPPLVRIAP